MKPDSSFLPPAAECPLTEDFQDRVIQRIRRRHSRQQNAIKGLVVCLFFFSATVTIRKYVEREPTVPQDGQVLSAKKGIDWLLSVQNEDGTWAAEQWGGHPAFKDGINALGTLALLNAPEPVSRNAFASAASALQKNLGDQSANALQGPRFYNHILTLYALSEVEKQYPDPQRRRELVSAYSRLIKSQQPGGGWGYQDGAAFQYQQHETANTAVTWWVCHLLTEYAFQESPEAQMALRRGKAWLKNRQLATGKIAYQSDARSVAGPADALYWMMNNTVPDKPNLSEMEKDIYRDYFISRHQHDQDLFSSLQKHQLENGSWENPDDRWLQAGGKIYLTALSVLVQVPKG